MCHEDKDAVPSPDITHCNTVGNGIIATAPALAYIIIRFGIHFTIFAITSSVVDDVKTHQPSLCPRSYDVNIPYISHFLTYVLLRKWRAVAGLEIGKRKL